MDEQIIILPVLPTTFEYQEYSNDDNQLISASILDTVFSSSTDYIEYYAYDENQNLIGEHNGVYFYTLGQRQGLGIGGIKGSLEQPWYVAAKDNQKNSLTVVQDNNHPLLFKSELTVKRINWLVESIPSLSNITSKIRYRQNEQVCSLEETSDGWKVLFEKPQRAITPGQSVVFYSGDVCLGGGEIE